MKSLGYITDMSKCHGAGVWSMEYITFYVQKHIAYLVACSGPSAGSRRAARGARICETRLLWVCFLWAAVTNMTIST